MMSIIHRNTRRARAITKIGQRVGIQPNTAWPIMKCETVQKEMHRQSQKSQEKKTTEIYFCSDHQISE